MFAWIAQNAATLIISVVLLAVVAVIVTKMVKDRKKGGCGCGCSSCESNSICHKQ